MTLKRSALRRTAPDAPAYAAAKVPRSRKCRICFQRFTPASENVTWCNEECGYLVSQAKVEKLARAKEKADRMAARLERLETKKKLEQYKPLSYWLAKTERACNSYIRARDPDICISCGVTHSSAWQAGHYIAVGANSTLRFNEDNIHKQCIQCNMFEGSNAIPYRAGLLEKIGLERLEWLESWHSPIKMTRAAAEELEAHYKAKLKALTNSRVSG